MRTANIQSTEVQAVVELFEKVYQDLPPELQEQVRADLNAGILKHAQENYGLPKSEGTSTKELVGWTIHNLAVPIGLGLLMLIISLYFY